MVSRANPNLEILQQRLMRADIRIGFILMKSYSREEIRTVYDIPLSTPRIQRQTIPPVLKRKAYFHTVHDSGGPGQNGTGVSVKESDLKGEDLIRYKKGYELYLYNAFVSDIIPLHRNFPPQILEKGCYDIEYDVNLPEVSVIIPFRNEAFSTLLRTVHSVLDKSNSDFLREIVLVDDGSDLEDLKTKLGLYLSHLPKVNLVRLPESKGLMTSRQTGINHAKSDVIIVMDSHIEVSPGWLEPLLQRIKDDPKVMVFPKMGGINSDNFEIAMSKLEDPVYLVTFDFFMAENHVPTKSEYLNSRPHRLAPIKAPGIQGMAFGINKAFFQSLGGFDLGMKVWGAEQYELSIKVWQCGGSIEMVPCSNAAHLYRNVAWINDLNKEKPNNNDRVIDVWMDDYAKIFKEMSGNKTKLQSGNITERLMVRKRNNCKSFQYFLDKIRQYVHYYVPENLKAKGRIENPASNLCVDGRTNALFSNELIIAYPCHLRGGPQYWEISENDEIRHGMICCSKKDHNIAAQSCNANNNHKWLYELSGELIHKESGLCLTVVASEQPLILAKCEHLPTQQWNMHRT
ncbi:polypeptide N-acetylgalactosaminyltransferase 5-like isoform X1 [Ostrea edulis]|uniref:polypeptide N-acetylgalactosaminyltransferase 5-like isoform X1 n=1 Tax=Ostrea edulis TaxID=37623 RepID=UPI0024AEB07E|nr:polypeptide N-acetylgalactosaminyltransferase 5-like isoform X1 [Ostrea edulis]